ncbi:MAG TPA: DNA-deoxyinosine glycosylase [Clostridia bacterium]|nr:DNA-deoxyinosine glycosylase [Clostridia bacterium]
MMKEQVKHNLEPVFDGNSRILILGTMPSRKSREAGFYYAHPQNRFWRVIAEVLSQELPITIEEKKTMLFENHIALWDVLRICNIKGSDDSSIDNPIANDMSVILSHANIKAIYTTGVKATTLYRKYCYPETKIDAIYLPSTSAANCARYSCINLIRAYQCILKHITS